MNRLRLYSRLAARNMVKNSRFYFPYLLTCIATSAMFYIMGFLANNPALDVMTGGTTLGQMLSLGVGVIGIFSVIFLFYTNSFLIKRRKQEFGLYNLLGMEKRHIANMLFFETLYAAFISISVGLLTGILFSKLMLLLLFKVVGALTPMGFYISISSIRATITLFALTFVAILLFTALQIRLSQPIALIKGGQVGEREPKGSRVITAIGFLTLFAGYILALKVESPLDALFTFFIAVLLVIVGTYALFISGSIALLKWLRKRKSYYYRPNHFTAVSGMFYRMKQNATGLASICILSTMVLITVSTTFSLYVGMEDIIETRFPTDFSVTLKDASNEQINQTLADIRNIVETNDQTLSNLSTYRMLSFSVTRQGNQLSVDVENTASNDFQIFYALTAEEFNALTGESVQLSGNDALCFTSMKTPFENGTLQIGEMYSLVGMLDSFPVIQDEPSLGVDVIGLVVADETALQALNAYNEQAYGSEESAIQGVLNFDTDGSAQDKRILSSQITDLVKQPVTYSYIDGNGETQTVTTYVAWMSAKEDDRMNFYTLYGGFLFLGIYLGAIFLMATVLIIYYKQISEGFSDQPRFEIMQKVGMSADEVRQSIRSQVLIVFFLPLAFAVLHVAVAFKMMSQLLGVLNLYNVPLYFICSVITLLIFAVVYTTVYMRTARTYYKIVSGSL